MLTFQYPTAEELREIEQDKLPALMADRPIFRFFPIRETDHSVIMWEQKDNWSGLQAFRGLDGAPQIVSRPGGKRFIEEPGEYGEFIRLSERELTERRPWGGPLDVTIPIDDLVMEGQDFLLQRRLDRIEWIGWQLLALGNFSVSAANGAVAHAGAYATQTFTSSVPWSTASTSTPLMDFRNATLKGRGHSVIFDQSAIALCNKTTAFQMFNNLNAADLYGRRTAGYGTVNSPAQFNELLMGDGLPQLEIYDGGYLDSTGTFQLWIPTGTVIMVGRRPSGVPVGEYVMTRNVNNPGGAPGAYTRVVDEQHIPRSVEVHDGHNGGPTILYPSAIVVMAVT